MEGPKHGSEDMGHEMGEELDMKGSSTIKCAKEKNRQAQRRFRERQKCLIQTLKERQEGLLKQVQTRMAILVLSSPTELCMVQEFQRDVWACCSTGRSWLLYRVAGLA